MTGADLIDISEKLGSIVLGGGLLSLFWAWRSDRLAQYRYLDESYSALLDAYREHPEFGDVAKTRTFQTSFATNQFEYHYFAMTVHNVMETIFDVLRKPLEKPQWARIFAHHALLHWTWLETNAGAFEVAYVAYVRDIPEREQARVDRQAA